MIVYPATEEILAKSTSVAESRAGRKNGTGTDLDEEMDKLFRGKAEVRSELPKSAHRKDLKTARYIDAEKARGKVKSGNEAAS